MDKNKIRVRFAPSPTGFLHIGGLRTALYNYLFAKKNNGVFVLRIEDTDRSRYVEGAVENLLNTLQWCGLEYDEGPVRGGPYGPYIQSERLSIYRENVQSLLDKQKAYYCFCTQERINNLRIEQEKKNLQTKYDKHCLNLSWTEIQNNLKNKIPYVVRLNIEQNQKVIVNDFIRGSVEFDTNLLDDQVLIKTDGYPTYHLANVVDDHLMNITHVIRGEEWLPSTPKHVLLYKAFEWELPVFAHLPLLLNPDRSKLSKRQGDVAVEDYREKGYLKEALINFVALLGWNPGTEEEFFYLDDLVRKFSLEAVNKSGAIFNIDKLNWLSFEHLRKKSDTEVLKMLRQILEKSEFSSEKYSDEYLLGVIEAMRPRVTFVKDFIDKSPYFFKFPISYDKDVVKKRWKDYIPQQLEVLIQELKKLENPQKIDYENVLKKTAEILSSSSGLSGKEIKNDLIHAVRLSLTGVGGGPGLYDIMYLLGKDETIKRIEYAIKNIGKD